MFCFLLDGVFVGLWGNKFGDIFFENTCRSMKWDRSKTSLYYFENFIESNTVENVFEFENGKMVFYTAIKDADGAVVGKGDVEFELVGELFVDNGLLIKAC